ncbi:MAG: hypothetical protein QOF78_1526, partial [Phycisphaerales bacterium]|nr:hypothetical protein [Phycisphaerales bacterium]
MRKLIPRLVLATLPLLLGAGP